MTPEAPSDPPLLTHSVRGHPFTYTDEGTGPILVAVHGLPGDGTDFRWLGTTLEPHFRFIRVNLPGFGGSSPNVGSLKWPDPAQFVAEVLEVLELNQVTLLGHSYGSVIANYASQLAADRVSRLVLLAPLGLRRHRGFDFFGSAGPVAKALRTPGLRALVIPMIRRAFRNAGFRKPLEDEHLCRTMEAVATWSFPRYREISSNLSVPVFGAYCEDDRLIEAEIMAEFLALCPPGPRLVFSTGGHNLQKTRAIELAEGLVNWLNKSGCTERPNPIPPTITESQT